ncbi:PfkB family carbohydrate kinase, partial [Escherichia coli]
ITGEPSMEEGLQPMGKHKIPLLLVTMGGEGSLLCFKGKVLMVPAMKVEVVDTTGAGDAFVSGFLYRLNESEKSLGEMSSMELEDMVRFASISGALAASKKGAMTALPALDEVNKIIDEKF